MAAEILKQQLNAGKARSLYYFRDRQGLEVDFVVPQGDRRLLILEIKASRTVFPAMAEPLESLARAVRGREVAGFLVHQSPKGGAAATPCRTGVTALPVEILNSILPGRA